LNQVERFFALITGRMIRRQYSRVGEGDLSEADKLEWLSGSVRLESFGGCHPRQASPL
jgi:hypothetical protein